MAAKDYQAKAFGVEIRKDLATAAQQQLRKFHVEERARTIQGTLFDVDLSRALEPRMLVKVYLGHSARIWVEDHFCVFSARC
ncbi:hypothetical protein MUP05_05440 [Candidatus Bathyarchaeota archaeon]|nr:hypothetical protein [Candidatus Bathyarchaeota archaeon]